MVHTCMNTHGLGLLPSSSNCTEKTKPQIGGESASRDLLGQTTRDTFTSTQLTAQLPKREIWNIITDQSASATSHNKTQVYFSPLSLTLSPCTGHELYMTRDKKIWCVKSKAKVLQVTLCGSNSPVTLGLRAYLSCDPIMRCITLWR